MAVVHKPPLDCQTLDGHPDKTPSPEHDGDGDVFDIFGTIGIPRVLTKPLHELLGEAVDEDDERFKKGGRDCSRIRGR